MTVDAERTGRVQCALDACALPYDRHVLALLVGHVPPHSRRLVPGSLRQSHSSSTRRSFFVRPRRFFAAILLSTARMLGFVGRLLRDGGAIASARIAASRSRAISRLRSCERSSCAATVSTPSTSRSARRWRALARCVGPRAVVVVRSRLSCTL